MVWPGACDDGGVPGGGEGGVERVAGLADVVFGRLDARWSVVDALSG